VIISAALVLLAYLLGRRKAKNCECDRIEQFRESDRLLQSHLSQDQLDSTRLEFATELTKDSQGEAATIEDMMFRSDEKDGPESS